MVESYEPLIPPDEFMTEYSRVNEIYKDEMKADQQ